MAADRNPSAHSAVTETSAYPVSKSSLTKDYSIPRPLKRGPVWAGLRHFRPKLVAAMSLGGHSLRT